MTCPTDRPDLVANPPTRRQRDSECDGFSRLTSPAAGAAMGSTILGSAITAAMLVSVDGLGAMLMFVAGIAVFCVAHLGLQFQAAILLLRDGRWSAALLDVGICTSSLAALFLLCAGLAGGIGWLVIAVVLVIGYTRALARSPR